MRIPALFLAAGAVGVVLTAVASTHEGKENPSQSVTFNQISAEGIGDAIGQVKFEDTEHGLLITPDLRDLKPGLHGFHIHQNPDCGPAEKNGKPSAGEAAGGHWDPQDTGEHRGPYAEAGHQGDLPTLFVDEEGRAQHPVLAPRVELEDLMGRSIIIHEGGDNYADEPEPLGGGGARVACAVVEDE